MFVDRDKQLATLEQQYNEPDSTFVVIYGRRRVGKTTLINRFLETHQDSVYFMARKESLEQNLGYFRRAVYDGLGVELDKDSDWESVFRQVLDHEPERKKIVVIDEFPYLSVKAPSFPSQMQYLWDTVLKGQNIMLILCGSLISMMRSQVLDYGSPLYGRRTAQICLKQVPFEYYHEFFPEADDRQLVEGYSVTGGVPKYIESFSGKGDIFRKIERNVLDPDYYLFNEPTFLLEKEVSDIGTYFSIIRTIAAGNHKLSDISSVLGVKQSDLTNYLKVLRELDLVERVVPVTEDYPEKSKSGLYRIKDNYLRFWFRFVYPNLDYLERGKVKEVMARIRGSFVENHVSFVYEDICREMVWDMFLDDPVPLLFNKVGSHWGGGQKETDIVAIDREGNTILLGECKYSKNRKDVSVLNDLRKKSEFFRKVTGIENVRFAVFSMSGFTEGLKNEARENGIILVEGLKRIS